MKTAIISDIHANPTALQTCIEDAERKGCTRFHCLGDIVGYGYDPNSCIAICREKNIPCLMGNHEAGLLGTLPLNWFSPVAKANIYRQQEIVTEENKTWLGRLKYSSTAKTADGFVAAFAHGTYEFPSRFDYINGYSDAALEFTSLRAKNIKALFVGHTHIANAYFCEEDFQISETFLDVEDECPLNLDASSCAIVNVGSCGYPRNQPYSIYCIYDDEKKTATHRVLPFDFEDYRLKMTAAGIDIPLWLESRERQAEDRPVQYK